MELKILERFYTLFKETGMKFSLPTAAQKLFENLNYIFN